MKQKTNSTNDNKEMKQEECELCKDRTYSIDEYNEETQKAFEEAENSSDYTDYKSLEEFKKALFSKDDED